ncbi:hypothetical protein Ccrd_009607, partial [Cynara cardunculus var. scolymus]
PNASCICQFIQYNPHVSIQASTQATAEENHRKQRAYRMRKFDPWPVFFKREFNRNWPFLVGFAITGTIITKFSLSLTDSDLLIVWIFFSGRGRQEKLRLCPKTQELKRLHSG